MAQIEWTHYDEEDNEIVHDLPAKWEICRVCDGEGKHSRALGAITWEEWERDWSFEEQEIYMQGGYDSTCEHCQGAGKVLVVDWDRLEKEDPDLYKARMEWEREEDDYRHVCEMERRMGA